MNILNLIIQNSKIPIYKSFYDILSPHYTKYSDFVDTYFIEFDDSIATNYIIKKDILLIKGCESFVPGLLWKTIDALQILINSPHHYDYIVRSNVSTVINFDVLKKKLFNNPQYFGGKVFNLNMLDPNYGIVDNRYFGIDFAQGTLIGFSSMLCDALLKKRFNLNFDLVDDVSIGVFVFENFPNIKCEEFKYVSVTEDETFCNAIHDRNFFLNLNKEYLPVAWRNKSFNRYNDLINMSFIVNVLNST